MNYPNLRLRLQIAMICDRVIDCARIRHEHGRCDVVVGPYRTAVPDKTRKYALFINGKERFFSNTGDAVEAFIIYVGHQQARAAYKTLEER